MNWKRILTVVLVLLSAVPVWAQGRIETKKYRIQDFRDRITKVVLTGNEFKDGIMKREVIDYWKVSPYEFCTMEEFGKLCTDKSLYFLLTVRGRIGKESQAGIDFLTLVKGGPEAKDGIDAMQEVVTIPYGPAGSGSGREFTYLSAILDIIQDFTLNAMEKDIRGYSGLSIYNANLGKSRKARLFFSEDDLSADADAAFMARYAGLDVNVKEEDPVDEIFSEGTHNSLCGFMIAPEDAAAGSWCYKMLIGAYDHKLYYFKRHRIGPRKGKGFLPQDIKAICKGR